MTAKRKCVTNRKQGAADDTFSALRNPRELLLHPYQTHDLCPDDLCLFDRMIIRHSFCLPRVPGPYPVRRQPCVSRFGFWRSPKVGAKPSCSFGADRPLVRQANDFSNNASPGWRERLSDRYFLGKVDVQHNEVITGLLERELRTPAFPRDSIPATAIPGIGMMIPLSPPPFKASCAWPLLPPSFP